MVDLRACGLKRLEKHLEKHPRIVFCYDKMEFDSFFYEYWIFVNSNLKTSQKRWDCLPDTSQIPFIAL